VRLRSGDLIRVADTLLRVEGDEPPAEDGRPPGDTSLFSASALLTRTETTAHGEAALREQAGRLRLLNDVHRVLAGPISVQALLDLILERAFEVLKADEGVVLLKQPDGQFVRAASRRKPDTPGELVHSRRLVREVTEKGMAALVLDVDTDARFAASESLFGAGVRSIVAAPLLDAEGCLGMIALHSRSGARGFTEHDLELLVAFAAAAALRLRNLELAEEAAERRVIDKELALAREIQMGMLPKSFPSREEVEIAADLRPATMVGGDLYDVHAEGDRLFFLIGDVSGKGVGAALFMAVTRTLFHAIVQVERSLQEAIERLNRELSRDNERVMFVTAFAGCLDLRHGALEYVNAGHNPPFRLGADGTVSVLPRAAAPALGVVLDQTYPVERLELAAGEGLYLFTDGVTEALDPQGEAFSEARLLACLREYAQEPVAVVVRRSLAAVSEFVAQAAPFDDLTVLALRYRPRPRK
jgi:serine phosphatase RsbU (regulator of sigma subunit)